MRVNILDPGLQHTGGHHPVWDLRLAQSLIRQGHDVRTYSNRNVAFAVRKDFEGIGDVEPHFSIDPYLHPLDIDPVSGELALFIDGAATLAQELASLRIADVWLWPTLFPHHLYATTMLSHVPPNSGCIHQQPNFQASYGTAFWRFSYQQCRRRHTPFALGVTGPPLQQEYSGLLGENAVTVLPSCHDGPSLAPPQKILRKVGFFGYQRAEKGTALLKPLIDRLIASGFEVLLHDSSNSVSVPLRRGLEVIGYVDDLHIPIMSCDLVVVLQHPENYRVRESGVAMDGIACGIPVIVAQGTASEARIKADGSGGIYHLLTVDSVMHTIELCQSRYPEIAAAAHVAAQRWSEKHGAERFAQSLITIAGISGEAIADY